MWHNCLGSFLIAVHFVIKEGDFLLLLLSVNFLRLGFYFYVEVAKTETFYNTMPYVVLQGLQLH